MTSHPPAKKRKMSKADHAQAMSAAFLNHLRVRGKVICQRGATAANAEGVGEGSRTSAQTNSVGNDQGDAGNATGGC